MKYSRVCNTHALYMDRNSFQDHELAMKTSVAAIQESALYQSIRSWNGFSAECLKIMHFIAEHDMLSDIHPIIWSKAKRLLSPIELQGALAAAEGRLQLLAL